ncbi:MAG: protein-L-isoaspartate(D-aspartate) O-methyltransferase [Bryobacteraceae bacterium]|nr:protein-L-isoaspartate(D-aspartate) O-methyltransferase [Bryobacteraceae bacterium]
MVNHSLLLLPLTPLLLQVQTASLPQIEIPKVVNQYAALRMKMVREQIEVRGVRSPQVLQAMRTTPRHRFVPEKQMQLAYADQPLPIGFGQTISQPYIVALMTELLNVDRSHKVLEIGTGSGYQTAVLAALADRVYSVEIVPELAQSAISTLRSLGYRNVSVINADGYQGWPDEAPFDRILLTAAPPEIPDALIAQLKPGGILVAPVGAAPRQQLVAIRRLEDGTLRREIVTMVSFVPMVRQQ